MFSPSARSAPMNCRGIILLATAPSSAALHPLISTAHIFEEVVTVIPPNKDARRDVRRFPRRFTLSQTSPLDSIEDCTGSSECIERPESISGVPNKFYLPSHPDGRLLCNRSARSDFASRASGHDENGQRKREGEYSPLN